MIIENVCKNITKEGVGQVVGEKIKAIRMEKGITAKDLAEKSEIHARRWKCSVSGWGQKAGAVPLCSIMKRQANVRLC